MKTQKINKFVYVYVFCFLLTGPGLSLEVLGVSSASF
jgi:hypothetical protein